MSLKSVLGSTGGHTELSDNQVGVFGYMNIGPYGHSMTIILVASNRNLANIPCYSE